MSNVTTTEPGVDYSGDYGARPHCGEVWANEFLRDDKRVPTHDYPRPCRSVCPGSGQMPAAPTTDQVRQWRAPGAYSDHE